MKKAGMVLLLLIPGMAFAMLAPEEITPQMISKFKEIQKSESMPKFEQWIEEGSLGDGIQPNIFN